MVEVKRRRSRGHGSTRPATSRFACYRRRTTRAPVRVPRLAPSDLIFFLFFIFFNIIIFILRKLTNPILPHRFPLPPCPAPHIHSPFPPPHTPSVVQHVHSPTFSPSSSYSSSFPAVSTYAHPSVATSAVPVLLVSSSVHSSHHHSPRPLASHLAQSFPATLPPVLAHPPAQTPDPGTPPYPQTLALLLLSTHVLVKLYTRSPRRSPCVCRSTSTTDSSSKNCKSSTSTCVPSATLHAIIATCNDVGSLTGTPMRNCIRDRHTASPTLARSNK